MGNDPFTGEFQANEEGVQYTLVMRTSDGQRYNGTLSLQGSKTPVSGTRSGNQLSGSYTKEGETYRYAAQASGGFLIVEFDDGDVVAMKRTR